MSNSDNVQYSPEFLEYFREQIVDYLEYVDLLESTKEDLDEFIDECDPEALQTLDDMQEELVDYHVGLFEYMDGCLTNLNYFLTMEEQLPAILDALKGKLSSIGPGVARLYDSEGLAQEIEQIIEDTFKSLHLVRSHFNDETKRDRAAFLDADAFTEEVMEENREIEIADMPDRMEYMYWFHYNRRLHLHAISDEMALWLDQQDGDPENRADHIANILSGYEAKRFPPSFITLEGFTEEEIEQAKLLMNSWEKNREQYADVIDPDQKQTERPAPKPVSAPDDGGAVVIQLRPRPKQ